MSGKRASITFSRVGTRIASRKWRRQPAVIVNLNQYREKRRRAEAQRRAVDNRVRFGRSKEEDGKDQRESERAKNELDGKRLD